MEFLFSPELILAFITLTFLEIVLGIDNLIFISLVVSNLPKEYRNKARYIGVGLALLMRIAMLFAVSWVMSLTKPLFTIFGLEFSFKNLLLIVGGLFLIIKSGLEICHDVRHDDITLDAAKYANKTFSGAVLQIMIVDFVFSFDSIITAIGMTDNLSIIIAAVVISMIVMLVASEKISIILQKYPSLKIMALAFIFLIGIVLLADGLHMEFSKGYVYVALFFAGIVEYLNIIAGANANKTR